MKVQKFEIRKSRMNKCLCLIAIVEDGAEFVVGGNSENSAAVVPIEMSWEFNPEHFGYTDSGTKIINPKS